MEQYFLPPADAHRDVRQNLLAFYRKYKPERLSDIDKILYSFRNREDELFEQLLLKYAPYGDKDLGLKPLPPHKLPTPPLTPPPPPPPRPIHEYPTPPPPPPPPAVTRSPLTLPAAAETSVGGQQHNIERSRLPPLASSNQGTPTAGPEPVTAMPPSPTASPIADSNSRRRDTRRLSRRSTVVTFSRPPTNALPRPSGDPDAVVAAAQATIAADSFFPAKPRTKSLVEVTDQTLQQAHAELARIAASLTSVDALEFQRTLNAFTELSSKVATMEAEDADEDELDKADAELQDTQNRLVGVVTQLQHAVKGFMAIAANVVEYSQQQSTLQEFRAQREAALERQLAQQQQPQQHSAAGDETTHARFAVTEYDSHYLQTSSNRGKVGALFAEASQFDPARPLDSSGSMPRKPSMLNQPGEALAAPVSSTAKVVFDVFPLGDEKNVVSDVILNQASPGDVIVLHPGEYRENMVVQHDVELRCALESSITAATSDRNVRDTVVILPADPTMPTLQVVGDGACRVTGIVFKRPKDERAAMLAAAGSVGKAGASRYGSAARTQTSSAFLSASTTPSVPLISVSGRATLTMRDACCSGGGGGLVCLGHSQARLNHCTFRRCSFSAVYAKDAAFVTISSSAFLECDVALRVRDATFSLESCDIRDCRKDALAFHGPAKGLVAKTKIDGAEDNGALLSPACEVVFSHCLVQNCGKHGVYAPIGADFAFVSCNFVNNTLGDASRQPPLESGLATRHNLHGAP
jgi:hypothetical protein